MQLGYAISTHKVQGATIPDRAVIHCREAFAPGMMYVMISRVTTSKNLKIVGLPLPSDFTPMLAFVNATGVNNGQPSRKRRRRPLAGPP